MNFQKNQSFHYTLEFYYNLLTLIERRAKWSKQIAYKYNNDIGGHVDVRSERQQRFSFRKYAVRFGIGTSVGCLFVVRLFWLRSRKGNWISLSQQKEESQAVNPTAGQDKDSAAAFQLIKSLLKLLHKSNPYLINSWDSPSHLTEPVSDPIPEKEAVGKKEQQDQSIPEGIQKIKKVLQKPDEALFRPWYAWRRIRDERSKYCRADPE